MSTLRFVMPMQAMPGPVSSGAGWAYEWKLDGMRAVVLVEGGEVHAYSRNGKPVTSCFPELGVLVAQKRPVLLDGEVVTPDAAGRPDFGRLQSRIHAQHLHGHAYEHAGLVLPVRCAPARRQQSST
jgi:bifunctional non-homologous end joining protein LigD